MKIEEYFQKNIDNDFNLWNTDLSCYPISGLNLVSEIKKLKHESILDVGCGYNEFKLYFPNLIGVDIANTNADWVGDILNYEVKDNSFDVILALGSVNFIDQQTVYNQMKWITQKLKVGGTIFMRVNPSYPPDSIIADSFYCWTLIDIFKIAESYGLTIENDSIKIEKRISSDKIRTGNTDEFSNLRLYWKYIKNEI